MRYQIILHRLHGLTDPAGRPTQMAVRSCNDIAMSKRMNVYVKVLPAVEQSSAINDYAMMWRDGEWHTLGTFANSKCIPAPVKKLYAIICNIEEAYRGI